MIKNLFFLLIFLSLFSCEKKENIAKVHNKTSDTLVITEKCAVSIFPTDKAIEKKKKEIGDENFYIGADDYAWYSHEADEFLNKRKIKIFYVNNEKDKKVIIFKSKFGDYKIFRDTIRDFGNTYLFEPNQLPKRVYDIDIESDFKKYFEKDSLKFSKKEETVKFNYNFIACPCAQWSVSKDKNKYSEKFFLERENNKLPKAEDLSDGNQIPFIVEATGNFSENKTVPKDFPEKGDAEKEKARIFKYSKIKILQLGKKKF